MIATREGILAILVEAGVRMDSASGPFHVSPILWQASQGWFSLREYKSTTEAESQHILPAKTGLSQHQVKGWGSDPAFSPL